MTKLIRAAEALAESFLCCTITALEFERQLLSLGFHSVRFGPRPSAVLNGILIPLTEH